MIVNYLGITFQVVREDTTSVTLHRVDANTNDADFVVMKDSQRYSAMFNKPKLSFASLVMEAKEELPKTHDPKFHNFLDKYAFDSTCYEGSTDALEALKQDIANDPTGLYKFIVTTFAYKANKVFNGSQWTDLLIDNIQVTQETPHYTPQLLEAYLNALDAPSEANVKALAKAVPQDFKDECINAILGFNFGVNAEWIISPKQAQSLLNELK